MIKNKTTAFKREYMDDIKYAVVAFTNTDGGKIYMSKKQRTHAVTIEA